MPGHTPEVCLGQLIPHPVVHALKVHDPVVVEVLAREHFVFHARRVHVGAGVLAIVPPAEAEVEPADEGEGVVNDDEFLVMRPVESHVARILKHIMIRMAHHSDVAVPRTTLRTQGLQSMLRMCGIAADGLLHLFVHDDVDLDSGLRLPLQHLIQPPLLIEVWRSSQEQFRAQPPVLDVNCFLRLLKRDRHGVEVVAPINIPFDLVAFALGSKGFEAVRFSNACTFLVSLLFVFFIVTVVGVDDVGEFADFVLEMEGRDFGIVEVGVCKTERWRDQRVRVKRLVRTLREDGGT